jgi:hypothetical protein
MATLKFCTECGKPYDIEVPPCPNCGAPAPVLAAASTVVESTDASGSPSPGWYPAPGNPKYQRYWDGEAWTGKVAPASAKLGNPKESQDGGLVLAGILTALLIPIIGFIIGIILLAKSNMRGLWIMLGSVGAFLFWFNQLQPGTF